MVLSRRGRLPVSAAAAAVAAVAALLLTLLPVWSAASAQENSVHLRPTLEPVDLRTGPQLFTDQRLIAESSGLTRSVPQGNAGGNGAAACWRTAGGSPGRLLTAPLRVRAGTGSYLAVNAVAAGGTIRVQVRDALGHVIPGYGFDDTLPLESDGAALPLRAKKSPAYRKPDEVLNLGFAQLDDQTIRLEFELTNAGLCGFELVPAEELPLRLGRGPHLFIDDHLIAKQENLSTVVHPPERLDRPMIVKPRVGDGRIICTGGTLAYDRDRDTFRFWNYESGPTKDRNHWFYRESKDPQNWPVDGKMVLHFDGFSTGVFDDGPRTADPGRRYRMMPFVIGTAPWGPWLYFSADGINWTPYESNPILPPFLTGDPTGLPPAPEGASDILDPFWDPVRHRYGLFAKSMSTKQVFQSGPKAGQPMRSRTAEGCVRTTCQLTSSDGIHWSQPRQVFEPDERDTGILEFYGAHVVPVGDLLIAFVRILRDDLGGEGTGYTVLAISRDGAYWQRLREPWLNHTEKPDAHDNAFAWVTSSTVKYGTRYFSYTAYNKGHKTGDRQSGLAWVRGERYVSRTATGGGAEGVLRTPLLRYNDGAPPGLTLNATVRQGGRIVVRACGADGPPIDGYDASEPVTGDGTELPVRWPKSLAELADRSFRLEFTLHDAEIFDFSFTGEGNTAATRQ